MPFGRPRFKTAIIISKFLPKRARKMSPDEETYAGNAGVQLVETPIALDSFIFIVNPGNPIKSLSTKQIQDIYTGKITD
jgi:phosphate transport system substrate-binding protein